MNKLKIFKYLFKYFTYEDSNQILLDLLSAALPIRHCSLIQILIGVYRLKKILVEGNAICFVASLKRKFIHIYETVKR